VVSRALPGAQNPCQFTNLPRFDQDDCRNNPGDFLSSLWGSDKCGYWARPGLLSKDVVFFKPLKKGGYFLYF
jgi:hypothetical protein